MILLSPDAVLDVERVRTFLEDKNPDAAKRALATIWAALERVERFPHLGMATDDPVIRQVIVRFSASAYIVRYTPLANDKGIIVTRIWHGRELRP